MKTVAISERGQRTGQDNGNAKYTDKEVENVRQLRDEGFTYPRIAEIMEMPYWTVSRICRHERRAVTCVRFKVVEA